MSDMPNDSIFLVVCENGYYSDYMTWVAAAYLSKAEAAAKESKMNARAKYQQAAYYGWCSARHRICRKRYAGKALWQLSLEQQNSLLTWPQPSSAVAGNDYNTLEVPIDRWGEYWPESRE